MNNKRDYPLLDELKEVDNINSKTIMWVNILLALTLLLIIFVIINKLFINIRLPNFFFSLIRDLIFALIFIYCLSLSDPKYKVNIDGITNYNLLGKRFISWNDITDFQEKKIGITFYYINTADGKGYSIFDKKVSAAIWQYLSEIKPEVAGELKQNLSTLWLHSQ